MHLPRIRLTRRGLGLALAVSTVLGAAACGQSNQTTSAPATTVRNSPASVLPKTDGTTATVSNPPATVAKAKAANVAIYDQPGAATPKANQPNPWLYDNQPEAKIPLVFLVKQDKGEWLEVYLASRPNGSTGWIKRSDVDLESNPYRLEIRLGAFNAKAYKGDELILDAPIALGTDDAPTPGGLYYTNVLLQPPDPKGDYGPYAFGLSGHSEKLQTFNGGDGQLGIHGTNQPDKIGSKVSHGCIRLRNDDITKLAEQLPLGTPVQILS